MSNSKHRENEVEIMMLEVTNVQIEKKNQIQPSKSETLDSFDHTIQSTNMSNKDAIISQNNEIFFYLAFRIRDDNSQTHDRYPCKFPGSHNGRMHHRYTKALLKLVNQAVQVDAFTSKIYGRYAH